jgi:hypothetical protein
VFISLYDAKKKVEVRLCWKFACEVRYLVFLVECYDHAELWMATLSGDSFDSAFVSSLKRRLITIVDSDNTNLL